jgi:hypothetical protein
MKILRHVDFYSPADEPRSDTPTAAASDTNTTAATVTWG